MQLELPDDRRFELIAEVKVGRNCPAPIVILKRTFRAMKMNVITYRSSFAVALQYVCIEQLVQKRKTNGETGFVFHSLKKYNEMEKPAIA